MKEKASPNKKAPKADVKPAPQPVVTADRPVWMDYLVNIWVFIPAILYFSTLSDYALNIPYIDDYDAILEFLNNFSQASFGQKMALIFSWHNEHKIVGARLIIALQYALTGSADFAMLKYIGSMQLVVSFWVLTTFLRPMFGKLWGIPAIILGFCIFDFSNYFNAMCTMAAVCNLGQVMLFLLSLYFYNSDKKSALYWAAAIQALCILSLGNGIICTIALVMFTLLKGDKKKIITSIAVSVIFVAIYFLVDVKGFTDMRPATANPGFNFSNSLMYFMNITGAHFAFTGEQAIANSYVYGILLLIVLGVAFPLEKKWRIKPDALPLVIVAISIFGTFATVAIFRAVEGNHFYTSRYLIYPHMLTAIGIILLAYKYWNHANQAIKWGVLGVGAVLTLFTYNKNKEYGISCFKMEERRLIGRPYYYNLTGDEKKDFEYAQKISIRSCELGIYCIEDER